MVKYVVFIILCFYFSSCILQSNDLIKGERLLVDDFSNKELQLSDFVENVDLYNLETDELLIGEIKDLCIYDSLLFFVDGITSNLVVYDLNNKKVVRFVNNRGNGPFEYIKPSALCADENYLYLLDSSSRKIIFYNHLLESQSEIRMDFSAFDFIKVDDGFLLCCALPEPSIDYKKIIFIGLDGEIKDSFIHTHQYGMIVGKNFIKGYNENVYVNIPFSNQIYNWTGKCLKECYHTDFGRLNIPQDDSVKDLSYYNYESNYVYNNNFFVTSSYFIHAFVCESKMHYHFYENETGKSHLGVMTDENSELPFFPLWQYNNKLIGLCRLEELSDSCKDYFSLKEREGLVALVFEIKN